MFQMKKKKKNNKKKKRYLREKKLKKKVVHTHFYSRDENMMPKIFLIINVESGEKFASFIILFFTRDSF